MNEEGTENMWKETLTQDLRYRHGSFFRWGRTRGKIFTRINRSAFDFSRMIGLRIRFIILILLFHWFNPFSGCFSGTIHRNFIHTFLVNVELAVLTLKTLFEQSLKQFLAMLTNRRNLVGVNQESMRNPNPSCQLSFNPSRSSHQRRTGWSSIPRWRCWQQLSFNHREERDTSQEKEHRVSINRHQSMTFSAHRVKLHHQRKERVISREQSVMQREKRGIKSSRNSRKMSKSFVATFSSFSLSLFLSIPEILSKEWKEMTHTPEPTFVEA